MASGIEKDPPWAGHVISLTIVRTARGYFGCPASRGLSHATANRLKTSLLIEGKALEMGDGKVNHKPATYRPFGRLQSSDEVALRLLVRLVILGA